MLVCHVPGGWTAPRAFEELFDPAVRALPGVTPMIPRCAALTLDLAHKSDAELQALELPPFQRLVLWGLRDARDPARLLASFDAWRQDLIDTGRDRSGALVVLIEYLFEVFDPLYWDQLHAKLRSLDPGNEEAMMTIADMFKEKGREEGLAKGRIEALRGTLRRLLILKFRALDAEIEARVQAATPEAIERYLERLLSAESIAAVFGERVRPGRGRRRPRRETSAGRGRR